MADDAGTFVNSAAKKDIAFKNLMNLVDMEERWMYRGSDTAPPCEGGYLWMVLATVYPLSAETLRQFRSAMISGSAYYPDGLYTGVGAKSLQVLGNWRTPVDATPAHEVTYV